MRGVRPRRSDVIPSRPCQTCSRSPVRHPTSSPVIRARTGLEWLSGHTAWSDGQARTTRLPQGVGAGLAVPEGIEPGQTQPPFPRSDEPHVPLAACRAGSLKDAPFLPRPVHHARQHGPARPIRQVETNGADLPSAADRPDPSQLARRPAPLGGPLRGAGVRLRDQNRWRLPTTAGSVICTTAPLRLELRGDVKRREAWMATSRPGHAPRKRPTQPRMAPAAFCSWYQR